jgi:hypothetical protein
MPRPPIARRIRLVSAVAGATLLLTAVALAAAGSGILFPDWSGPTQGSYDAPYAEIGNKSSAARPWSVTTFASSIDGKPLGGKPVSVVGEIVDLSCYLQVGKHGDKHRDCGQKCARNGQPVGLLEEDGTIYMLIDEEHDPRRDGLTEFRKYAIENMANVVKINGTLSEVEGQKAIFVQGFLSN